MRQKMLPDQVRCGAGARFRHGRERFCAVENVGWETANHSGAAESIQTFRQANHFGRRESVGYRSGSRGNASYRLDFWLPACHIGVDKEDGIEAGYFGSEFGRKLDDTAGSHAMARAEEFEYPMSGAIVAPQRIANSNAQRCQLNPSRRDRAEFQQDRAIPQSGASGPWREWNRRGRGRSIGWPPRRG